MTITPRRWREIESLFDAALREPEEGRRRYVDAAAGADSELRDQVFAMLRSDVLATGPIDVSVPTWLAGCDAGEATPTPGTVIGAWQLVERLGEGGMGTVFRARRHDGAYEQEAALKLLRFVADEQAVRRFAEERQILAHLSHPSIARLLDGGTTSTGEPFMVMELVDGDPIDVFAEKHRLDARACIQLVLQIAAAVEHAHGNLIVHGDIKPANVLVDDAGRPRLLDFGIARILGSTDGAAHEHAYLTPAYSSPERRRGAPLSTAADVYSLGVLLDELLAEQRGKPRSKDLSAVVDKARQPDEELRYPSVAQLSDDLRRVVERRPVTARRQHIVRHAVLFARRNRMASALAMLALSALVAGTVVALRFASIARDERDAARTARAAMARERDHAAIEAESAQLTTAFLSETFLTGRRMEERERDRLRAATLRRVARIRRQFADQPHMRANLLDAQADALTRIGCADDAEAIVREVLALRIDTFGADSLEVALSRQSVGELLFTRREFEAAREEFERAYDLHKAAPDSVHADVATAANNLAACLRALGRRSESRRFHEEALALRLRSGRRTLPVAESLNNLGVLAIDDGEIERAEELLAEALATRRTMLGDDAPLTLQSATNLASVYWQEGEPARALETLRTSAKALLEHRGAGDPQLLHVLMNLSGMELMHGDPEAALATADEARHTLARLGQDESRTALRVLRLLAQAHRDAGRPAAAAEQHRVALALLRRLAPNDEQAAIELQVDLALCLVEAQDFPAAAPIIDDLHAIPAERLAQEAPLVDYLRAVRAAAAGEQEQARTLATRALPELEQRFGPAHSLVVNARALARND